MNEIIVQAFVDEFAKLATATPPPGFLRRHSKSLALLGAGAGLHSLGQDVVNDYRMGRMMRKQNEASQSF